MNELWVQLCCAIFGWLIPTNHDVDSKLRQLCIGLQKRKCQKKVTKWQHTILPMYPAANELSTHPWPCMSHLNTSVICMMAIGITTRSAALMKLASAHKAMVLEAFVKVTFTMVVFFIGYSLVRPWFWQFICLCCALANATMPNNWVRSWKEEEWKEIVK